MLQEPGTKHDVGGPGCDRIGEPRDIGDGVLAIGVEGHQHRRAFAKGKAKARLQGRALSAIDGVANNHGPGLAGAGRCLVARTIVNHYHRVVGFGERTDNIGNHPGFVVGGHHDPDAGRHISGH
jgi:hypothetical protein